MRFAGISASQNFLDMLDCQNHDRSAWKRVNLLEVTKGLILDPICWALKMP